MTGRALEQLVARMPLLAQAQHPLGLQPPRAAEFAALVQSTGEVAQALRKTGGDLQLAAVLTRAKPSDPVSVLLSLVPTVGEVAALRRALKGAAAYPLTLVASFAVAGWAIFTLSLPALAMLSGGAAGGRATELTVIGICLALLFALAAITGGGLRVPGFSWGHTLLDRAVLLETAAVLVGGGARLGEAVSAAAAGSSGALATASHALARAFSTGGTAGEVEPLLDGNSAAILGAAAQRGVAAPVLRALADQALLEARRRIPDEIRRVHALCLTFAGLALLALAAGWYQTYLHAVTG